jgi:ferritin-like metal-binding protein YciE
MSESGWTTMFERFESQRDVYGYRLGATLTMEHDWLGMLPLLTDSARSDNVEDFFEFCAAQTRQQIAELNALFDLVGYAPARYPSPASSALVRSESALLGKCAPELREGVAVASAMMLDGVRVAAYTILFETLPGGVHPMARVKVGTLLADARRVHGGFQAVLGELSHGTALETPTAPIREPREGTAS